MVKLILSLVTQGTWSLEVWPHMARDQNQGSEARKTFEGQDSGQFSAGHDGVHNPTDQDHEHPAGLLHVKVYTLLKVRTVDTLLKVDMLLKVKTVGKSLQIRKLELFYT